MSGAAATCAQNGWTVGTVLRGHEEWANGRGLWSTILITAIGETSILARCVRHEKTDGGVVVDDRPCRHDEHTWTLAFRDWRPVAAQPTTTEAS